MYALYTNNFILFISKTFAYKYYVIKQIVWKQIFQHTKTWNFNLFQLYGKSGMTTTKRRKLNGKWTWIDRDSACMRMRERERVRYTKFKFIQTFLKMLNVYHRFNTISFIMRALHRMLISLNVNKQMSLREISWHGIKRKNQSVK